MTRALIVEASSTMQSYLRAALEDMPELGDDLQVDEAASGFDALRLLPRNLYDLVITGIDLPDMSGMEVIRFMRQNAHLKGTAVLVISTQATERDRARALALGADFLGKPFTPDQVRSAVVRSLAARGAAPPAADVLAAGRVDGEQRSTPAIGERAEEVSADVVADQPGERDGQDRA